MLSGAALRAARAPALLRSSQVPPPPSPTPRQTFALLRGRRVCGRESAEPFLGGQAALARSAAGTRGAVTDEFVGRGSAAGA